ncbi:MAG: hypothetical protein JSS02_34940 [Planctomycetes bacterium]|nr:hypothetical protein [Planctomycetota bacterium]
MFIDEFQRIVANNLELLLQTARSLNIGLILSNQSTSDLEAGDANLLPAIRANTRWRQNFSVSNIREIEELRDASGETIVNPAVMSFVPALLTGYFPGGITFSETRTARMGINDILLAGDAPGRSIATLRRSAGFAQFGGFPFIMDSVYPISLSEFQARLRAPWPAPSAETLVATLKDVSPGAQSRSRVLPPATHPVPIDDPGRDEPEADEFPPDMGIENERPAVPDDVQCKSSNSVDHAAEEIEEISFEHFPEAAQESPEPSTPPETPEQVADSFQFLDSLMLEQMERDERRRRIKKKAAKKERDRTTDQNTLPGMM